MSWLTIISSQFIYLVVIALLCRLDDMLLLPRESRPAATVSVGAVAADTSWRIPSTSGSYISMEDQAVPTVLILL